MRATRLDRNKGRAGRPRPSTGLGLRPDRQGASRREAARRRRLREVRPKLRPREAPPPEPANGSPGC